ncbi:MAG TPA: tetratricopeptide repeat protein [Solirubrobacterales bacterium]|nr:tetratricopeptide repeat protein [Solirubrobacterales bacterium]
MKYPRAGVGVMVGAPAAAGAVALAAGASLVGIVLLAADAALVLLLAILRVAEIVFERREELSQHLNHPLCTVEELTPYGLGADPEAPAALERTGQSEHASYLERDIDVELRAALDAAARSSGEMVVVYGPSKAGKTRTLYEAVRASMPRATGVVPRDAGSIDALLEEKITAVGEQEVLVWWLEDLEDYVEVGGKGMSPQALRRLSGSGGNVVVVATAGGKGGTWRGGDAREQLAEPLADLLHHAEVVELESELSEEEVERTRAYAPEAAAAIERDGIGEFMITAPELEMKLGSGKHRPVDEENPHGQAVAWTAIAWRRVGIVEPIPRATLRALYGYFLSEHVDPSDAGFDDGLGWARKPLYKTVALLKGSRDAVVAHDHVASAGTLPKEVDGTLWRRILEAATPQQAFSMGLVAYRRHGQGTESKERAEAAWRRAAELSEGNLAGISLFNLGVLLRQEERLDEAEEAYRTVLELDLKGEDLRVKSLAAYADTVNIRGFSTRARELLDRAVAIDPEHALALAIYAIFEKDQGSDHERVEELFERAIAADPTDATHVGNYAAFLAVDRKDPDRADEMFERAIALDPDHAINVTNYALFQMEHREEPDLEDVEGLHEQSIAADPDDPNVLSSYAVFLASVREDHDRAEEFFKRAVELDPDHDRSVGNFAFFYASIRGDFDRAEALYERAVEAGSDPSILKSYAIFLRRDRKDSDRAEEMFERMVAAEPDDADSFCIYAVFLAETRRRSDRAEEMFERAIAIDPFDPDNLLNYATFFITACDDPDRAEALFERALAADPAHQGVLSRYAHFQREVRNDLDHAGELYKRLADADPIHLVTYARFLGQVRQDHDRAEEVFERAVSESPDQADDIGSYALFQKNVRGDHDRAEELYELALAAEPGHEINLNNFAYFLSSVRQELDRAEELYERAIAAAPQSSYGLRQHAYFQKTARGDLDRAGDLYEQAVATNPEDLESLSDYALMLDEVNESERAEEIYEQALRLDPENANLLGNYARLSLARGEEDKARSLIERSLVVAEQPPLLAELCIYRLVLDPEDEEAKGQLNGLIAAGVRSPGWDFEGVMSVARTRRHPEVEWLERMAEIVSSGTSEELLPGPKG